MCFSPLLLHEKPEAWLLASQTVSSDESLIMRLWASSPHQLLLLLMLMMIVFARPTLFRACPGSTCRQGGAEEDP